MKREIITPNDGYHYFFGYYDLQPYSSDGRRHLAHRVEFFDRMPTAEDVAELGYIDIDTHSFVPVAKTRAWNFQQGALLQWFERDKSIMFNDFDGEKYISRVVDLSGRELRRYDIPVATASVEAGVAISINFSRVYDFRPGYGYANIPDKNKDVNLPSDDGIFLLDLKTGEYRLLHSYVDLAERFSEEPFSSHKLVVNHINLSPKGTRYVFLLRNFDPEGKKWRTVLAAGDLMGDLTQLTKFEVNSHYSWRDERTLMIWSILSDGRGIFFIDTVTGERELLDSPLCNKGDIHCNYAPDKARFIGDSYPDPDKNRAIYYYDFPTKSAWELFKVYSVPTTNTDIRCDLHARWYDDGQKISYDTTENCRREICEARELI